MEYQHSAQTLTLDYYYCTVLALRSAHHAQGTRPRRLVSLSCCSRSIAEHQQQQQGTHGRWWCRKQTPLLEKRHRLTWQNLHVTASVGTDGANHDPGACRCICIYVMTMTMVGIPSTRFCCYSCGTLHTTTCTHAGTRICRWSDEIDLRVCVDIPKRICCGDICTEIEISHTQDSKKKMLEALEYNLGFRLQD